jgi:hypothetical protein
MSEVDALLDRLAAERDVAADEDDRPVPDDDTDRRAET